MNTRYSDLKIINVEDFPQDSELGKLYDRYMNHFDDRPLRRDLERLKAESRELENWLKQARIGDSEAMFLQKFARSELLKRTIVEVEKQVIERERDDQSRKLRLDEEYTRYRSAVITLRSGQLENQPTRARELYKTVLSLSLSQAELKEAHRTKFASIGSSG